MYLELVFTQPLTLFPRLAAGQTATEQQLQCYACGMPRVHPENDILGSYGVKKYNHSCQCELHFDQDIVYPKMCN